MEDSKRYRIKQTGIETRLRRLTMDCRIIELKVDQSKISKKIKLRLEQCFFEAKWIYNAAIASQNVFTFKTGKTVEVKTFNPISGICDLTEERNLTIGSQIRQSLVNRARNNVLNLNKLRKKGTKAGKLKFKNEIKSLPLVQNGGDFRIKKNFILVQKIGKLFVNGLDQVKNNYEIANANLIKKASGYYINITVFIPKVKTEKSGEIGLDFGIKDSVVDSNGVKLNWSFDTKKIKRDARRLSKKKKGSKNKLKAKKKLQKSYEKLTRQKDNEANQFVSTLKKYEKVVIQNENLKGWQAGLFGKQIQETILGRIKTKIKNLETSQVIDRFLPTTQLCPKCEIKNKIPLSQRDYSCSCGYYHPDRDVKAAQTILTYGKILGEPKTKPVEKTTSFWDTFSILSKLNSEKQEALTSEVVHFKK